LLIEFADIVGGITLALAALGRRLPRWSWEHDLSPSGEQACSLCTRLSSTQREICLSRVFENKPPHPRSSLTWTGSLPQIIAQPAAMAPEELLKNEPMDA